MAIIEFDPNKLQGEPKALYEKWSSAFNQFDRAEAPLRKSILSLKEQTTLAVKTITGGDQPDVTDLWLLTASHFTSEAPSPEPQPAFTHHSLILKPHPSDLISPSQARIVSAAYGKTFIHDDSRSLYFNPDQDHIISLPLYRPPQSDHLIINKSSKITLKQRDDLTTQPLRLSLHQTEELIPINTSIGQTFVDVSVIFLDLLYQYPTVSALQFNHQFAKSQTETLSQSTDQLNNITTNSQFPLIIAINQAQSVLNHINTIINPPKPNLLQRLSNLTHISKKIT